MAHFRTGVLLIALCSPVCFAQIQSASPTAVRPRSTGSVPQEVLDDFIAGFSGDDKALDRAMGASGSIIAKDPENAEALAWNSAGKGAQCGKAFQSGDFKQGMELWQASKSGLNRSVDLAPENPRIRIVRGKSMLETSLHDPNPVSSNQAAELAVSDLEKAVSIFGEDFEKSPDGFRKELYSWLYQAAAKMGDKEKAEKYKALAEDKGNEAQQRLNESAGNTIAETAQAALVILDSEFVRSINDDILGGLRSPARLDAVITSLDTRLEAKPTDATAASWRGFTRTLRTSSLFAQGKVEEGTKLMDKGVAEIVRSASDDPLCRDAVLLRALTHIERGRHEANEPKRIEAANKAKTDLDRFTRLTADAGVTLTPDAKAELCMSTARAYFLTGEFEKGKAELEKGLLGKPSEPVAKRIKSILQLFDVKWEGDTKK